MESTIFQTNFTTADWGLVFLYLLGSVAIGVWVNRYVKGLADFVVAGRGLGLYLAISSMTGTEIGLVTYMYNAQEGFERGLSAYVIGVCWGLGLLIVGLTGFIIRPLREAAIMTIPEYYELRYSRKARVLGGTILALAGILNMGLFLQAGARFMTCVLGIGTGMGLKLLMTAMCILMLIYTVLGGMVSIVIVDYTQFVVLGGATVIATVWVLTHVSFGDITSAVLEHRGLAGLNPVAPDGYGWLYVFWMIYMGVAAGSLWATATARALSSRNADVAQKLYGWASITFLARVVLPVTWGAAALAYISTRPELAAVFLREHPTLSTQYAMPVFFARIFPPGLIGIVTAGMMAAFMSAQDSYLLMWASVITQDIIAPMYKFGPRGRAWVGCAAGILGGMCVAATVYGVAGLLHVPGLWRLVGIIPGVWLAAWLVRFVPKLLEPDDLPERGRIVLTRILIVLVGLFLLVWGLWYEAPSTLWTYMAITGTVYLAGAFVCIVAGIYWRGASEAGALAALSLGLLAIPGVFPWKDWGYPGITETKIAIVTIILCALGMVVGSLIWPRKIQPRQQEYR
jgi:SSS family solute:Na+ symporter